MAYNPNIKSPWKQSRVMTCPHCLHEYELGRTGTIYGCDSCEGIVRDAHGLIITDLSGQNFITKVDPS